jgi:exosome complex exonuclease RRP6
MADDTVTLDTVLGHTSTTTSKHAYLDDLFKKLTAMTKMSNGLPNKTGDFDFYASFPEFRASLDETGDGILDLLQHLYSLIASADIASPLDLSSLGALTDDDNFEQMSDVLDLLMESIDSSLDEAQGIDRTTMQKLVTKNELSSNNDSSSSSSSSSTLSNITALSSASVSVKPQVLHQWSIDNDRKTKFRPRILSTSKTKPNAISALDRNSPKSRERLPSAIRHAVESHARDSLGADVDKMETEAGNYQHPYLVEIESLKRSNEFYKRPSKATMYKGLKETTCTWVDTKETLAAMCEHLNAHHEYAIDLEHHHYRSFQGFVCLMQISTRENDYLIDTIALRNELHILNEYFTDPERVKVLHGADRDILWLQRDLGLYIVNMFDTGQASRVLNYTSKSLSYLLKLHCNVSAQKQYQQADWRIRPLPTVLVNYAREDTHYLLFIYDIMRMELMDQDIALLDEVYSRSDTICLKRYTKEVFTSLRYLDVIRNLR